MTKLTEKQEKFVKSYVSNGRNAYQAAKDAGYTPGTAVVESHRMLSRPHVKAVIDQSLQYINDQIAEELGITVKEKARVLSRILYDIVPKDESQTPLRSHYKDAIKVLQELNKMQGHHAATKNVSLTLDGTLETMNEVKRIYEEY